MVDAVKKEEQSTEFAKADPTKNPRYQLFKEIAEKSNARADAEAAETAPQDKLPEGFEPAPDEDKGGVELEGAEPELEEPGEGEEPVAESATTEAENATEEPAGDEEEGVATIEADAMYEGIVNGKKVQIPGHKLIEAGYRTYQKEAAADEKLAVASERLELASRLLDEARARSAALSQGTQGQPEPAKKPTEDAEPLNEVELARAIQFGNEEQAAAAIKKLRAATSRGAITPEQVQGLFQSIPQMVDQRLQLNDARRYAETEYADILDKPLLKSLFDAMEMQARQNGNQTAPRQLYKEIGDAIRAQLNMPVPTKEEPKTREQKIEAKKKAPSMPRTAASRLEQRDGTPTPRTPSQIISSMAKARGQGAQTLKPN